jgi:hypothetical protein
MGCHNGKLVIFWELSNWKKVVIEVHMKMATTFKLSQKTEPVLLSKIGLTG